MVQTLVEGYYDLGEGLKVGGVFVAIDGDSVGSVMTTADDVVSGGQCSCEAGMYLRKSKSGDFKGETANERV